MSDWGWVALAYLIVYGTLGTYTLSLVRRQRQFDGRETNR